MRESHDPHNNHMVQLVYNLWIVSSGDLSYYSKW